MHLICYSCCIFGDDWIWFFHCHKIHIFVLVLSNIWETCSTLNISGLVLREIKDFWRVALLLSILSYPEAENAAETFNKQDELQRRREKYTRVERSITDLGKVVNAGCRICGFPITASVWIYLFIWFVDCPGLLFHFSRSWWGVEVEAGTRREIYYGSYAGEVRRSTDRKMGRLWLCSLPQSQANSWPWKTMTKNMFLVAATTCTEVAACASQRNRGRVHRVDEAVTIETTKSRIQHLIVIGILSNRP